mmetsp:Transcript_40352/g.108238  ORF Transcript_40352/g.108238 Transcript_40352/m.108238 type:complete len:408 (+) Transcript_40352:121-1344(+)
MCRALSACSGGACLPGKAAHAAAAIAPTTLPDLHPSLELQHGHPGALLELVRLKVGGIVRGALEQPGQHEVEGRVAVRFPQLLGLGACARRLVDAPDPLPVGRVTPPRRQRYVVHVLGPDVQAELRGGALAEQLRHPGDRLGLHVEEHVARRSADDLADADALGGPLQLRLQQLVEHPPQRPQLRLRGLEEAGHGDVQGVHVRGVYAHHRGALGPLVVHGLRERGARGGLQVHQILVRDVLVAGRRARAPVWDRRERGRQVYGRGVGAAQGGRLGRPHGGALLAPRLARPLDVLLGRLLLVLARVLDGRHAGAAQLEGQGRHVPVRALVPLLLVLVGGRKERDLDVLRHVVAHRLRVPLEGVPVLLQSVYQRAHLDAAAILPAHGARVHPQLHVEGGVLRSHWVVEA